MTSGAVQAFKKIHGSSMVSARLCNRFEQRKIRNVLVGVAIRRPLSIRPLQTQVVLSLWPAPNLSPRLARPMGSPLNDDHRLP